DSIAQALNSVRAEPVEAQVIRQLIDTFEHAKTFGSLIQIPDALNSQLPALADALEKANETGDLYAQAAAQDLMALVEQAKVLGRKFDAVVANPPYMGGKAYCEKLKKFTRDFYTDARSDLFACFIERGNDQLKKSGLSSMVTMESWMFLTSYERFRKTITRGYTIRNLAHFPYDGKRPTVMGINFGVAVVTI
ncbi:MAG: Eco57I restriction-modification methylase domain-containing protein, partial [Acinetobacter johnsonii]|nr:Eco57I restriction-modification methylase domain-containing protein [Acinetobacter johnsonii]